jgi:hypothetical protein
MTTQAAYDAAIKADEDAQAAYNAANDALTAFESRPKPARGTLQYDEYQLTLAQLDSAATRAAQAASAASTARLNTTPPIAVEPVVSQEPNDATTTTTDNVAENPSGEVEYPNTQAFEDGSTLETFEDGSTRAVDTDGNETTTSPTNFAPLNAEEDPTNAYKPNDDEKGTDEIDASAENGAAASDETKSSYGEENDRPESNTRSPVPRGARPADPAAAQAQWSEAKDLRVKLRVPNEYLTGKAAGPSNILQKNGGILFPYTPQISMENTANYSAQNPLHSNYPLYFYKNSSISPINVTAKFTVQNEFEGAVLLSIIHMLRALTKMKFGNDPDAGAPPPVCRFDAYGDYMMFNVPVSIASWRHELPDGVDYISVGRKGSPTTYGHSMVPTMSTISLTLNPMYSRREMLEYNTKNWLSGSLERRGYL